MRGQIANPRASSAMPPGLVKGQDARDYARRLKRAQIDALVDYLLKP